MRRRWLGWTAWLLMAACLYFFENNTGTRIVLLCSLLFPLVPPLRAALSVPVSAESDTDKSAEQLTVQTFTRREADEPGEIRPYVPGDPVRRIHWKLSAKKDELLVRGTAFGPETAAEEKPTVSPASGQARAARRRLVTELALVLLICLLLLLLVPGIRLSAQALCNRLFAASERVNAYAYVYFPVPDGQSVAVAAVLAGIGAAALAALAVLVRGGALAFGLAAACALFQIYFGLALPAWANAALYSLLALRLIGRPVLRRENLLAFGAAVLAVSLLTALLLPGVSTRTEAASEAVRDRLSQLAQQVTGSAQEIRDGTAETRHVHTRTLETGGQEARADREYRLVTEAEERISMPRWVNWFRVALLLLLSAALVILPFAPFALLNARRKRAQEARRAFSSENVSEAVCAVFRQVIAWLSETGHGAGNALYREWTPQLPAGLPEGYDIRFAQCAADFEEAAYSGHALPEEKRRRALDLLSETETALWEKADWRLRLRLKYWMCLRE